MESTFLHVANHGRPAEIARSTNLLSTNKTDFPLSFSLSLGFVCKVTNAMTAFATAAALSLPNSLFRSSKLNCKKVTFCLYLLAKFIWVLAKFSGRDSYNCWFVTSFSFKHISLQRDWKMAFNSLKYYYAICLTW